MFFVVCKLQTCSCGLIFLRPPEVAFMGILRSYLGNCENWQRSYTLWQGHYNGHYRNSNKIFPTNQYFLISQLCSLYPQCPTSKVSIFLLKSVFFTHHSGLCLCTHIKCVLTFCPIFTFSHVPLSLSFSPPIQFDVNFTDMEFGTESWAIITFEVKFC